MHGKKCLVKLTILVSKSRGISSNLSPKTRGIHESLGLWQCSGHEIYVWSSIVLLMTSSINQLIFYGVVHKWRHGQRAKGNVFCADIKNDLLLKSVTIGEGGKWNCCNSITFSGSKHYPWFHSTTFTVLVFVCLVFRILSWKEVSLLGREVGFDSLISFWKLSQVLFSVIALEPGTAEIKN